MEVGVIVGRKIRQYRERTGKTQLSFALSAYLSPSYVSRFERGVVANPTKSTLEYIAQTIGVSLEELIHEDGAPEGRREEGPPLTDLSYENYLYYRKRYMALPVWRRRQFQMVLDALLMESG